MKDTNGEWAWLAAPIILSVGKYTWDVVTDRRDFSYAGLAWSTVGALPAVRGAYVATQVTSNLLKTYYLVSGGMTSYMIGSYNPF
ncbi:hypothetical protein [Persephonella sp.]